MKGKLSKAGTSKRKSFAPITEDCIISTESPEAISLKYKATFFLAVIRSIINAFGPILKNFNAERYHWFSQQMTRYTNRCQDLQSGSLTITQLWGIDAKKIREDEAKENVDLDDIIENFYYHIAVFFEGCNASIQEKILAALDDQIHEGIDEHGSKERLQEILAKLYAHKKIGELDNTYHPKGDALLNTYIIGAAIHSIDGSFSPSIKPVADLRKSRRDSVLALLPHFYFQSGSKKSQQLANFEEIEIQEITAALPDEDIYNNIDRNIKPKLFSGEVCQHKKVQKQFAEIFEMERSFLNFFKSIIEKELPYIKENVALKGAQRQFIEGFIKKLTSCLVTQKELCNRMEKCGSNFPLDELGSINQNAIHVFLGIYEEHNLKEQMDSFLQLMDCWVKIDALLAEHKESLNKLVKKHETEILKDFEKYQQEITKGLQEHSEENNRLLIERLKEDEQKRILPTIAYAQSYALSSRVAQICTRRIMISTEVLESLKLDDLSRKELEIVRKQYKFLCYLCNQYNLVMKIKQDGYICPEDLDVLLKTHFDAKERYSLAYFLIHSEAEKSLKIFKETFLSFARQFDGNESRIEFFKEIFELFQKKPFFLRDLEFLQTYIVGNPLKLNAEILAAIKRALESNEPNSVIKVKNIIRSLIPGIADVSSQLNKALKQFQQSPDVIDVLLTVPDIKEKIGEENSLAVLDKESIANLPAFWREIFVSEEGVLRKSLAQKKALLLSHRIDAPEEVNKGLMTFLDEDLSFDYDHFIMQRNLIAQKLFVREIEKQIKLLGGEEGIFSDDILTMLTSCIYDQIVPNLLEKLLFSRVHEEFFLFYYAEAILQIPYVLMQILEKHFEAENKRIKEMGEVVGNRAIFAGGFSPNTQDTALNLESLIALLKENQRNRPHFHKSEKTTAAFRVFDLVKEKSKPDVYQTLKKEISALSSQPAKLSKKPRSIAGPTPGGKRLLPNGMPPEDSGSATPLPTPVVANSQNEKPRPNITSPYRTPLSAVKSKITGHMDFKKLVSELDTVAKAERLQLKKYIRSDAGTLKECHTAKEKEKCNYLEVHKSEKLLLTAQSSGKDSSVTVYCHEDNLVAKTVAAMAKSVSMRDTVATLEINISVSNEKEKQSLIQQYVTQAINQNLFPKVIVNGIDLKPGELCDKLDKSLAQKYDEIKDEVKQGNLSKNRMGHFATRLNDKQSTARKRLFQDPTDRRSVILS